ncbi:MAG: TIGR04282 family arsenosugar biosynthesis glycosyltransferase [Parvibaculaceae bacterium]
MKREGGRASWLVVMSKAPRLGTVKTRLAKDIGAGAALRFYRSNTVNLLRRVSDDPRWETVIAVAPDAAVGDTGFWPEELPRVPQGGGDLGERMDSVMHSMPPGPVVLIGCDIPGVTRAHIAKAFHALGSHDAVFGPAEDGGYWLVGLKRFPRVPAIFGNVRWSSEHALRDTLANLEGASVAFLETLTDIDTGADLERWRTTRGHRHGH